MLPFTNKQLAKIATFGAVFVAGNAVLMHYLTTVRFQQSPYFINAAKILMSNQSLVKYLGEPISFGNPNLSDNATNFSTDKEAKFVVPVKGSSTKGIMKFSAIRIQLLEENNNETASPLSSWKITNLEVTVDDRPTEKLVLVRGPSS